jgi:hypothetical protein
MQKVGKCGSKRPLRSYENTVRDSGSGPGFQWHALVKTVITFRVQLKVETVLLTGTWLTFLSADGFCSMKLLNLQLFNDTASTADATQRRMTSEDTTEAGVDTDDACCLSSHSS